MLSLFVTLSFTLFHFVLLSKKIKIYFYQNVYKEILHLSYVQFVYFKSLLIIIIIFMLKVVQITDLYCDFNILAISLSNRKLYIFMIGMK